MKIFLLTVYFARVWAREQYLKNEREWKGEKENEKKRERERKWERLELGKNQFLLFS